MSSAASDVYKRQGYAASFKYLAAEYVNSSMYDRVLFVDCDCLIVKSINQLLGGSGIRFAEEEGLSIQSPPFNGYLTDQEMDTLKVNGINSGVWSVPGSEHATLSKEWEHWNTSKRRRGDPFGWWEQPAWNRVVLDSKVSSEPIEASAIAYPVFKPYTISELDRAAIHHFCGPKMPVTRKLECMIGLYMKTFYGDAAPFVLDFLEI